MVRNLVVLPLLLLVSVLGMGCFAVQLEDGQNLPVSTFIEGRHYQLLESKLPVDPEAPVMEFMYYGCETCLKLAPAVAEWSHRSEIGVTLVPAHSQNTMVDAARMFHTFELLGVFDSMYEEGYQLYQSRESTLQGEERVNESLARHSINKEKFWTVWKSPAVEQRLRASEQLTQMAKVYKTPTFVVHGIYKVDISSLSNIKELFLLLDYLAAKTPNVAPALLKKIE